MNDGVRREEAMWARRGQAFQAEDAASAKALGQRPAQPACGIVKRTENRVWNSADEAEHCKRRGQFGARTPQSDEQREEPDFLLWAGLQLIRGGPPTSLGRALSSVH